MKKEGITSRDRVGRIRGLNETEKVSLIFTQQRKLGEFEQRIKAFECCHREGGCVLCRDKDLTIIQLQQQINNLKDKLYGRTTERRGRGKGGSNKNRGNPKGGADKRTRLPSDQFPEARINETTLEDSVAPICEGCCEKMVDSGLRETSERLEYQPAEIYIERTHRVKYNCKCCHSNLKTATMPERMAPGTSLGDSLIIQTCISKFYDLTATSRFAKILSRHKAAISHQLLLKAQSIMAFIMTAVYQTIRQQIINNNIVLADETIHRQLEENGGKWRWYLWAFSDQKSIYFEIHDTRAGDVSIKFLLHSVAQFLVSDAHTGYFRTIREINEIREQKQLPLLKSCLCNDHSRRYFYYAQADVKAKEALDLYDKIYMIERKVQEILKISEVAKKQVKEKALELRQTADPLFNQIYDISCEILMDAPENSLESKAALYFINHNQGLTLYLRHVELPISNAFTERGIRDPVQLRKISLGNHSKVAAEEGAVLLTIMSSCKLAKVNPSEYLEFNRLKYLSKQPLLTPCQYKELRSTDSYSTTTDSS